MPTSSHLSERCAVAQSAIHMHARRLAARVGMHPCDRDDLVQDLWLTLLEYWQRTSLHLIESPQQRRSATPHPCRQVVEDVDHAATLWLHSYRQRQRESIRTIQAAAWLAEGLAVAKHDEATTRELRLDLANILAQMPDNLRAFCQDVIQDEPDAPLWAITRHGGTGRAARLTALRRYFRRRGHQYDLHHYFQST